MIVRICAVWALVMTPFAWGETWSLDDELSQLSFVTTKAGDVAEVHTFRTLRGSVGADGSTQVTIDLASVDTLIPIRDERMREILFRTATFPSATIELAVDARALGDMGPGDTRELMLDGTLRMVGETLPVRMDVYVARLTRERVLVGSRAPVIVNAASLGLVAGVEKLREIAGLPSISKAVPVSFVLNFVAD